MEKVKPSRVVVPFTGYLHHEPEPIPEPPKQTTPLIMLAGLLFIAGIAIGAISVYQSASYVQIQHLKAQAKRLSDVQKTVCNN